MQEMMFLRGFLEDPQLPFLNLWQWAGLGWRVGRGSPFYFFTITHSFFYFSKEKAQSYRDHVYITLEVKPLAKQEAWKHWVGHYFRGSEWLYWLSDKPCQKSGLILGGSRISCQPHWVVNTSDLWLWSLCKWGTMKKRVPKISIAGPKKQQLKNSFSFFPSIYLCEKGFLKAWCHL